VFGQKKTPTDVAEDIFRYLVDDARDKQDFTISEAVVTVPIYFDGHARRALRTAAEGAGIYIKTFVHEPFAALVGYVCGAYGHDGLRDMEGKNILVFDWGGGTLDITIGRVSSGRIVELATAGLSDLAGDHFDESLGRVGMRMFQDRQKVSADKVKMSPAADDRFRVECERTKIRLSEEDSQRIELGDFARVVDEAFDLSEVIRREEFEAEIKAITEQALTKVNVALQAANLTSRQVDLALLIGGSSLIPLVQHQLREMFGHTVVSVENANSIIAEGAAIVDAMNLQPSFAASVALELSDGKSYEVFKAGELAIPSTCRKTVNLFCTDNRDGQARLVVGLTEPANGEFKRKRIITLPVSSELPSPCNHERVTAEFAVDQDLVLHIDAKAATQSRGEHEEVVDLKFALTITGADE
jgi:molecular chaperone DnaK